MLTSSDEDAIIFQAYMAGAIDYVIKSEFYEIIDAIRAAYKIALLYVQRLHIK